MKILRHLLIPIGLWLMLNPVYATVYEKPEDFLQQVFNNEVPAPKILWISGELREAAEKILQHAPNTLRTRYWYKGTRSAWILEEIGKEKPITVGIVVNNGKIEAMRVLIFRESRGWEVKYPFFTNQFKQAELRGDLELNKPIDGITGATLSVRALTRLGRLALYFHARIAEAP